MVCHWLQQEEEEWQAGLEVVQMGLAVALRLTPGGCQCGHCCNRLSTRSLMEKSQGMVAAVVAEVQTQHLPCQLLQLSHQMAAHQLEAVEVDLQRQLLQHLSSASCPWGLADCPACPDASAHWLGAVWEHMGLWAGAQPWASLAV